jgi:hypothetical protein
MYHVGMDFNQDNRTEIEIIVDGIFDGVKQELGDDIGDLQMSINELSQLLGSGLDVDEDGPRLVCFGVVYKFMFKEFLKEFFEIREE